MIGSMERQEEREGALEIGRARGRGAQVNPGNRFESVRLRVLGEAMDAARLERPEGAQVATRVYADSTRTIINPVDSPDLGFKWTINPYRGCEHGCVYCYARPTHEALGFSCGLDFETKIVAKLDAGRLLRRELARPSWRAETIVMSGVTDPYQPVEAELKITRACLEVMVECRQPVGMVTKNSMIARDLDLLGELARHGAVSAAVSITTLDNALARKMEPRASAPRERLATIERLARAGVPVGVMVAPVIPGLTDHEAPAILKGAAEAGATRAGTILLRLPHGVKGVFLEWLAREFPDRAGKVESLLRQARGGRLYEAKFGERQTGKGERAEKVRETFALFARKFGLDGEWPSLSNAGFRRPRGEGEMGLFDGVGEG